MENLRILGATIKKINCHGALGPGFVYPVYVYKLNLFKCEKKLNLNSHYYTQYQYDMLGH
jgi:hypothetical protein